MNALPPRVVAALSRVAGDEVVPGLEIAHGVRDLGLGRVGPGALSRVAGGPLTGRCCGWCGAPCPHCVGDVPLPEGFGRIERRPDGPVDAAALRGLLDEMTPDGGERQSARHRRIRPVPRADR